MADESVGKIYLDLGINQNGLSRELNGLGISLKSQIGKIGAMAAVAFSAKKIFDFGKQAVEIASNLDEVQNVVDTAFGNMSYKMEQFADVAIKQFGISQLSAKRTGSTFMAMAKGMDLPAESASNMALQLTGLSADIASFYNISQELAETKLKSVFTGETETLKDLGIVMTQANLQAFALSKGITKNIQDMSQAEQVQLRYAFVMKQTELAQGDFSKTSGSWANQTRILSESWKEFLGTLGVGIKNVLTPLIQWLNVAMQKVIQTTNVIKSVINSMRGISDSENENAKSGAAMSDSLSDIGTSADKTAKKIKKSLMGFDELNILTQNTAENSDEVSNSLGNISAPDLIGTSNIDIKVNDNVTETVGQIQEVMGRFKNWYITNFKSIFDDFGEKLRPQLDRLEENLIVVFSDIQRWCEPFGNWFKNQFTPLLQTAAVTIGNILIGLFDTFNTVFSDIWNVAVRPGVENFLTNILPMFTDFHTRTVEVFGLLFNEVKQIFDALWAEAAVPAMELFTHIWTDAWQVIKAKYDEYAAPIFENLKTAIVTASELLLSHWENFLRPIFDSCIKAIRELWDNHLKGFFEKVLDFIGTLIEEGLNIYNKFLAPVVKWIQTVMYPIVLLAINNIIKIFGILAGSIIDRIGDVITVLKGFLTFWSGVFTGDLTKVAEGIKGVFKGVADFIKDTFLTVIRLAAHTINDFIDKINFLIEKGGSILASFGIDVDFKIPKIPEFAKGGIVTQPTLAMVGERGREAVMPLENNTGWIDELAGKLSLLINNSNVGNNTSNTGTANVVLELNGTELGRVIVDTVKSYQRQVGAVVL